MSRIDGMSASDMRRLSLSACLRCRRTLSALDRKYYTPRREPDHCGFCELPLTGRARGQQPRIQGASGC